MKLGLPKEDIHCCSLQCIMPYEQRSYKPAWAIVPAVWLQGTVHWNSNSSSAIIHKVCHTLRRMEHNFWQGNMGHDVMSFPMDSSAPKFSKLFLKIHSAAFPKPSLSCDTTSQFTYQRAQLVCQSSETTGFPPLHQSGTWGLIQIRITVQDEGCFKPSPLYLSSNTQKPWRASICSTGVNIQNLHQQLCIILMHHSNLPYN